MRLSITDNDGNVLGIINGVEAEFGVDAEELMSEISDIIRHGLTTVECSNVRVTEDGELVDEFVVERSTVDAQLYEYLDYVYGELDIEVV